MLYETSRLFWWTLRVETMECDWSSRRRGFEGTEDGWLYYHGRRPAIEEQPPRCGRKLKKGTTTYYLLLAAHCSSSESSKQLKCEWVLGTQPTKNTAWTKYSSKSGKKIWPLLQSRKNSMPHTLGWLQFFWLHKFFWITVKIYWISVKVLANWCW